MRYFVYIVFLFLFFANFSCSQHYKDNGFLIKSGNNKKMYRDVSIYPLIIILDERLPDYEKNVKEAIEFYNKSCESQIFDYLELMSLETVEAHIQSLAYSDPRIRLAIPIKKSSEKTEKLGITTLISAPNGEILGVIVHLNIEKLSKKTEKIKTWVIIHELGHTLGLARDDNPNSIMYSKENNENHFISQKDCERIKGNLE